ncbi:EamA family transporter [Deefgea tanakiae]|uniref:EamA family transporter n=1 Tax=Deefgea tanakiae TaxID=2865840 RepID=A0ABX8Z7R1_9NEIS|nr:EamA family transporter [Deefgea tanakiae]QZA78598.1 EamA family transporter [Deefgea tanakiae]
MPIRDLALALIVVLAWGFNFVVIKWGLVGVPPLLLATLRFAATVFPAIFFLRRPNLPWKYLLGYGLTWGVCHFAFLFSAMANGMPAGLASVVLQSQAFFTLIFAAVWLKESWKTSQLIGLIVAGCGLWLIGSSHGQSMTLLGFVMTLLGAAGWAMGNIVMKQCAKQGISFSVPAFMVWTSIAPMFVFALLSLIIEGPEQISSALKHFTLQSTLAVLYLAFIATLLGTSLWNVLLKRHPSNRVAPFSLLVPWVGLSASAVLLDEILLTAQWWGAALLMSGLLLNLFGGNVVQRWVNKRQVA